MTRPRETIKYGQIQDAICAYINNIDGSIKMLLNKLEEHADNGSGPLHPETTDSLYYWCKTEIARLSAIIEVHHDVLDDTGKTSYLIKATEMMDEIWVCYDILDLIASNS